MIINSHSMPCRPVKNVVYSYMSGGAPVITSGDSGNLHRNIEGTMIEGTMQWGLYMEEVVWGAYISTRGGLH